MLIMSELRTCEYSCRLYTIGLSLTPLRVSNMAFNGHHKTATLQISSLTWQEAFHTISVDFGSSNPWPDVHLRDQNVLRKRQASNSAGSTNSTPTLTFPAPPTSSPSETSVSQSINGQLLNTIIMPPQIPVADLFEYGYCCIFRD